MLNATRRTVDVSGIPVGYYVAGDGPPLVLLHGGTGHPESSFADLPEELTRSRTVIVPGYSGSTLTPLPEDGTEVSVELVVDQLVGVVEAVGLGPVDIFGISTGAVVAAAAAGRHPERFRRLVLLGGFVHYQEPWQRLLARTWLKLAQVDANAFAEFTLLHVLSDECVDSLSSAERFRLRAGLAPTEGMVALVEFVSRVDISEYVGRIEAPTLVIGMTRDQLVPVRYARRFRDLIPGSEYVEVDSGHAVAVERPAELLKIVEEFLG